MLNLTTFNEMNLKNEVRESILLDEDDLSDVEDDVFIRDGKHGFRLIDDLTAKRPLMASSHRRLLRPKNLTRLESRLSCRAFLRRCFFALIALSILIGLITIVVAAVSYMSHHNSFLKRWLQIPIVALNSTNSWSVVPCNELKASNVWATDLPFILTDTPVRFLDVNSDTNEDVIFGFKTHTHNTNMLGEEFCNLFFSRSYPCNGGVIALDGLTGVLLWKYWTNDTIFDVHCTNDLNNDGQRDCLAVGIGGVLVAINSKTGTQMWQRIFVNEILLPAFTSDQNNDTIADIVVSRSSLEEPVGYFTLLCGRTGRDLIHNPLPRNIQSFFTPQFISLNNTEYMIFATGMPNAPGNLNIIQLTDLIAGKFVKSVSIYKDLNKGVTSPVILADINEDNVTDIIFTASYSILVAVNGATFQLMWQFNASKSEITTLPVLAYFNNDNIPDFMVIVSTYDDILKYNYTEAYIINGKNGKTIYEKSITDINGFQFESVSLSLQGHGLDMYLMWTTTCNFNATSSSLTDGLTTAVENKDFCSNGTPSLNLYALNQYDQPPGFKILSNAVHSNEEKNIRPILDYFRRKSQLNEQVTPTLRKSYIQNLNKDDFGKNNDLLEKLSPTSSEDEYEYSDKGFDYLEKKRNLDTKANLRSQNRDIYNYENMKQAKHRLLNDLSELPTDILRQTWSLQNPHLIQRDISQQGSDLDPNNRSTTLWDLESEKELQERQSNYFREKREIPLNPVPKLIISSGITIPKLVKSKNAFQITFITDSSSILTSGKDIKKQIVLQCVQDKISALKDENMAPSPNNQNLLLKLCLREQGSLSNGIPHFKEIYQFAMNKISVHRVNIECICHDIKPNEECGCILDQSNQRWPNYMGLHGDGKFNA